MMTTTANIICIIPTTSFVLEEERENIAANVRKITASFLAQMTAVNAQMYGFSHFLEFYS